MTEAGRDVSEVLSSPWSRVVSAYARLPAFRGKHRLFSAILAQRPFKAAWSHYGVALTNHAGDKTFEFGLLGSYGDFIPSVLRDYRDVDLFVDIGANQGIFSIYAACIVGIKRVLSIEPHPISARLLRDNIALNAAHACCVLEGAVSNAAGAELLMVFDRLHSGAARVTETSDAARDVVSVRNLGISEIDASVGSAGTVLVKIDTEGHELSVLRKLETSAWLSGRCVALIVETSLEDYPYCEVVRELAKYGLNVGGEFVQGDHRDVLFRRS